MTYNELRKLDDILNKLELIAVEILQGKDTVIDVGYIESLNTDAINTLDEMVPRPLPTRLEFNEKEHSTNTE